MSTHQAMSSGGARAQVAQRSSRSSARAAELHGLLEQLLALNAELLEVIRAKLEAMRRSDTAGIQRSVEHEARTVAEVQRTDALRRCVVQQLARDVGLQPAATEQPLLSVLASRLDAASGQRLRDAGGRLQALLLDLARANARARAVAQQMFNWHRALLQEAAGGSGAAAVYSRCGRAKGAPQPQLIDATY